MYIMTYAYANLDIPHKSKIHICVYTEKHLIVLKSYIFCCQNAIGGLLSQYKQSSVLPVCYLCAPLIRKQIHRFLQYLSELCYLLSFFFMKYMQC